MSWAAVSTIGAVTVEPVDLAAAKAHCRVLHSDDDALIGGLVAAARDYVESYTGLLIAKRELTLRASRWANLSAPPVAPVTAIKSITYFDSAGAEQTLPADAYQLLGTLFEASVLPVAGTFPAAAVGRPITSACEAGAVVPAAVRHALLLLIGHWYEQREAAASGALFDVLHGVDALLANYRRHS